uniref:Uncharacterized protein n=1 Tax=uncultured bacterium contig00085 TaxID=1181558 RepID=A0A806JZ55_9BACT|nr:hypothetical protein [uncultured bacterium contig00085]
MAFGVKIENRQRPKFVTKAKALLKLSEVYSLKHLEIITFNSELSIVQNGKHIKATPIWKWLGTII